MMAPLRRDLLKAALVAGSGALVGCTNGKDGGPEKAPAVPAIHWRVQSAWDAGTLGFNLLRELCASIKELTQGRLELEPFAAGALADTFEMLGALRSGKLDAINSFPGYFVKEIPACAFFTSYPLGMDRPDHWETWFYQLGGLELARRAFAEHGGFFVGPIQHDLNIIHSRVPIRSFEDFAGKRIRLPGGIISEVFEAAGVKTMTVAGADIYPKLESQEIDAAEFVGPAIDYDLGFGKVAKYVILGPPSTPSLHQPVDLWALIVATSKWNALPKHLQDLVVVATRQYSWSFYASIQKANLAAWERYRDAGVTVIRLTEADVAKFRKVAIPFWFKWARKDVLTREAFGSQLAFMKSQGIAYLTDAELVDADGKKLSL
jgi:TRAP-type mannitol/chloroaromatic compound transport system substrate-binding protein